MKARNIVIIIVIALLGVAGYAKFLDHTVNTSKQETYEFKVGDRVWDIPGDCPGVVYRVDRGLPFDERRYSIQSFPNGKRTDRWVIEGALDPLTNQTSRSHER